MPGNKSGKFFLGKSFGSFEELETELGKFGKSTFAQFWKRDSRKISSVGEKLNRNVDSRLVYYEIKYACIFGGRKIRRSAAPGQQEIPTTRLDCPVKIYLRVSADGKSLEVKGLNTEHNHECSKSLFAQQPLIRRRSLNTNPTDPPPKRRGSKNSGAAKTMNAKTNSKSKTVSNKTQSPARASPIKTAAIKAAATKTAAAKAVVTKPVKLGSSSTKTGLAKTQSVKKSVLAKTSSSKVAAKSSPSKQTKARQSLVKPPKKILVGQKKVDSFAASDMDILIDLWNSDVSTDAARHADTVKSVVQNLTDKYDADVELLKDETSGQLLGLYLQTSCMKKTLDAFPEFVAIDGTFTLCRDSQPAYFCLVEDGNCQCQLAAMALVRRADHHSFEWFVRTLHSANAGCHARARYVLTDRSLIQLDVLQHRYPLVPLLPAVFHAPLTFDRQLEQLSNLSRNQRIVCAEYFRKMVSATGETDFAEHYERFREVAPQSVLTHYTSHWHASRWEWALTARDEYRGHFLANINAAVEGVNRLLEAGIGRNAPTAREQLLQRLVTVIARLENERQSMAKSRTIKNEPTVETNSDAELYAKLLNRQPTKLVLKQLEGAARVALPPPDRRDIYSVSTPEGTAGVNVRSCTCSCAKATLLPCRHIFAVRRVSQAPVYDESLCHERWWRSYYDRYQAALANSSREKPKLINTRVESKPLKSSSSSFTSEERVTRVVNSLVKLVVERPTVLDERLALLEKLRDCWIAGRNTVLQVSAPSCELTNGDVVVGNGVDGGSSNDDESEKLGGVVSNGMSVAPSGSKKRQLQSSRQNEVKKKKSRSVYSVGENLS